MIRANQARSKAENLSRELPAIASFLDGAIFAVISRASSWPGTRVRRISTGTPPGK